MKRPNALKNKLVLEEIKFCKEVAKTGRPKEAYKKTINRVQPKYAQIPASRLMKRPDIQAEIEKQRLRLENMGGDAIEKLHEIITTGKERNALDAAIFVTEQVHGKAIQKTIEEKVVFNFSMDLSNMDS